MKIRYHIAFLASVLSLAVGCYEDRSDSADKEIADIEIKSNTTDIINIYLGEEVSFAPDVTTAGKELSYQWSVGEYNMDYWDVIQTQFKEVSTDKDFAYKPEKLGHYHVRQVVTNEYGSEIKYYEVYVNSEFEEGYFILGRREDGHGSISFMKFLTPEEEAAGMTPEFRHDLFEYVNDGAEIAIDPVDCGKVYGHIFIACGEGQRVYQIDFKSFQVAYEYDLSQYQPDFRLIGLATEDSYYCRNLIAPSLNGGVLNLQRNDLEMFPWSEITQDVSFDALYYRPSYFSSIIILFANKQAGVLYALDLPDYVYLPCEDYFVGREIIQMFSDYDENIIVYTRDGDDHAITKIGSGIRDWRSLELLLMYERPVTDTGVMTPGSKVLANDPLSCVIFHKENRIYRWFYNQEDMPSQPFITLPEGETITTIEQDDAHGELYVGTYNPSRQGRKGSFHVFNPDTGARIGQAWEGVADRPVKVMFKKRDM